MDPQQGNIKVRITGPLWGEFTGHRRIPLTKGQQRTKKVPFDDVTMFHKIQDTISICAVVNNLTDCYRPMISNWVTTFQGVCDLNFLSMDRGKIADVGFKNIFRYEKIEALL